MPIYEYRCEYDGAFEVSRPVGTAPDSASCPACDRQARRTFSVSMVRLGSRPAVFAAMDQAAKTRYEPDVVTSLPSTGARRATRTLPLTPALRRLPRP
jgi:putative FmdB family regulatory protein